MASDLVNQIAHEAEVLRTAPVIHPTVGNIARCGLCGKVVSKNDLHQFDTHVRGGKRYACGGCNPNRGS